MSSKYLAVSIRVEVDMSVCLLRMRESVAPFVVGASLHTVPPAMSCFLHLPRPHQRMPASGAPSGECGGGAVETRMAIRILPPSPAYQAAAMRLGDDWIAGSGLIA